MQARRAAPTLTATMVSKFPARRIYERPLTPLALRLYRQMQGGQMLGVHGRQLRGATRLHGWVVYR